LKGYKINSFSIYFGMNRHYSKVTENYAYEYRNDFSDESLQAFFFIIALHWSGGDSSGKKLFY